MKLSGCKHGTALGVGERAGTPLTDTGKSEPDGSNRNDLTS